MYRIAAASLLLLSSVVQTSSPDPAFEVISIHEAVPGKPLKMGFYGHAGGRVEMGGWLTMFISYALDVNSQLISGGPDWGKKTFYQINAVPPEASPSRTLSLDGATSAPTPEQRTMILSMLVDRFGLKYHIEEHEMPVYLLERGKGPLRLDPPAHPERASDPRGAVQMRSDGVATGEGFGQQISMGFLATALVRPMQRPVVDRTGITGIYDFKVDPVDPENRDPARAAILMTQALGLKLTSGRAPVRTVVIDAATLPTPN